MPDRTLMNTFAADDTSGDGPTRALSAGRVPKVAEVVARQIVRDIRGLLPFTRLPSEPEMLRTYRVARNSLREALRILEIQGLIAIRPGTGGGPIVDVVRPRKYANMTSLYFHVLGSTYRSVMEARLAIEPLMARLAAERRDRSACERLLALAKEPPTDVENYLDTERDFHTLVSLSAGNPVLDLISRSLKIIYTDKIYEGTVSEDMRRQIVRDHSEIARAIADGKSANAERLMRKHMETFVSDVSARNTHELDAIIDWH